MDTEMYRLCSHPPELPSHHVGCCSFVHIYFVAQLHFHCLHFASKTKRLYSNTGLLPLRGLQLISRVVTTTSTPRYLGTHLLGDTYSFIDTDIPSSSSCLNLRTNPQRLPRKLVPRQRRQRRHRKRRLAVPPHQP